MSDISIYPSILRFIQGVQPVPSDAETAEKGYTEIISLLGVAGQDGYFLDTERGWQAGYPQLKSGGLYTQNALVDGKQLIAAAYDDVLETFVIVVKASSWLTHATLMSRLFRLRDNAALFHTSEYQIDPVFIEYRHQEAKASQFALIRTIDIASSELDQPDANQVAVTRVTLKVMREGNWRIVVPPGGNPRLWQYWKQGLVFGQDYVFTGINEVTEINDFRLHSNGGAEPGETDFVRYEIFQNRFEWSGGGTSYAAYLSHNWIDIDAEDIPGDVPADVQFTFSPTGDPTRPTSHIMVARYTGPRTFYGREIDSDILAYNILACPDGHIAAVGTTANDACGIYCNDQVANRKIETYSIGGSSAWIRILQWVGGQGVVPPISIPQFTGTWVAFLRCQQTDGAVGDVQMRLVIEHGYQVTYGAALTLDPQTMPYVAPVAGCIEYRLAYLGQFTLPFPNHPWSNERGIGQFINGDVSDCVAISVEVKNLNASARTLEFVDLVLMPIHEAFAIVTAQSSQLKHVSSNGLVIYDNTGYATHGKQQDYANGTVGITSPSTYFPLEIRGNSIRLKPGVNNRLYFAVQNYYPVGAFEYSRPILDYNVRLSIVPRCLGITDVEPTP